jgi:hypothetical protein
MPFYSSLVKVKKMEITNNQNYAIAFSLGTFNYHRERSYIICESGTNTTDNAGRSVFVGTFTAHLHYRGNFKFTCYLEDIMGKQFYSVDKEKVS